MLKSKSFFSALKSEANFEQLVNEVSSSELSSKSRSVVHYTKRFNTDIHMIPTLCVYHLRGRVKVTEFTYFLSISNTWCDHMN